MTEDDIVTVDFYADGIGTREYRLDEKVLPDRTCGQFSSGWWAFQVDNSDNELFIESPGFEDNEPAIAYDFDKDTCGFTRAIGKVVAVNGSRVH